MVCLATVSPRSELRQHGASAAANKVLADALKENPHVPAYLTGKNRIRNNLPPLIGMGDEDEAIAYASDHLNHWRRTPAAIEWLKERSQAKRRPPAPRRRKARRPKRKL